MPLLKVDMAKFKTELLNSMNAETKRGRDRQNVTVYLHRKNFTEFKKMIKPLTPSQVFDRWILETLEAETKKKK